MDACVMCGKYAGEDSQVCWRCAREQENDCSTCENKQSIKCLHCKWWRVALYDSEKKMRKMWNR